MEAKEYEEGEEQPVSSYSDVMKALTDRAIAQAMGTAFPPQSAPKPRYLGTFDGYTPPLLVNGCLTGLRSFKPDSDGFLHGPAYPAKIIHSGENIAECFGGWGSARYDHKTAQQSCSCGFYAYSDGDRNEFRYRTNIAGVIEGYGRTTVGELGFRCEKMRIVALVGPVPKPDDKSRHYFRDFNTFMMKWANNTRLAIASIALAVVLVIAFSILIKITDADGFWGTAAAIVGWVPLYGPLYGTFVDMKRTLGGLGMPNEEYPILVNWSKIKANYPDVKWYETQAEMLEAHPLTDLEEYTG